MSEKIISASLPIERWQLGDMLGRLAKGYLGRYPTEKVDITFLEEHPFRLKVPAFKRDWHGSRHVVCLGFPGYTESSVRAMRAVIAASLEYAGRENEMYLRIIKCPRDAREPDVHCDLFFELGDHSYVHIVGGCNNYSGGGGEGGTELTNLFTFMHALFDIPLEYAVIAPGVWKPARERLIDEVNQHRIKR